jgi:hypothetical protein
MIDAPALPFRAGVRLQARSFSVLRAGWLTSPAATLVLLTLAFPFAALASRPLFGDVFWMLAYGRYMLETGALPIADPFSFAPQSDMYFHVQWLAHVAMATVERWGGAEGVMFFNAVVVTATFGILLHLAFERSRSIIAAAIATLLAEVTAFWFLYPRAQTMAMLTFAATWWLLERKRVGPHTLIALVVVEAVWANMHGSFFLGPLLAGLMLAGLLIESVLNGTWRTLARDHRARFLVIAMGAQLVATLVNPYGPSLYLYLSNMSSDPIVRGLVTEWLPTSVAKAEGAIFFTALVMTLVVFGLAGWRLAISDLLILGVFGVLGITASRNVPWWALVVAPILAISLTRAALPKPVSELVRALAPRGGRGRATFIRLALIGMIVVSSVPWARAHQVWLPAELRVAVSDAYPKGAATYMESHNLGSRVFNTQYWGAYIDWRLWPRYQPILDAFIEMHPVEVWRDARLITDGHVRWEELLDKYAVDTLLLEDVVESDQLIQAIDRSPRWLRVYKDDVAVIYVRTEPSA